MEINIPKGLMCDKTQTNEPNLSRCGFDLCDRSSYIGAHKLGYFQCPDVTHGIKSSQE